jgi:flagellar basal-body rod protein FlgB
VSIKVFDRTFEALSKSLDLRSQRQVIISGNIANADTPGYQAKTLDFESALAKALTYDEGLGRSPEAAIQDVRGEIYNQINNVVREDGNTVDRDAEMTALAENQILYNAAADLVRKKLAMLKYSISDGGGN